MAGIKQVGEHVLDPLIGEAIDLMIVRKFRGRFEKAAHFGLGLKPA
ncbi:MAG: hypothetical protein ACFB2Z_04195 [Maricaulaceae bacterium]